MENKNPLVEKFGKQKRWVNYTLVPMKGRMTKIPFSPITKRNASSMKKSDWGTFKQAEATKTGEKNQIGIVFTEDRTLLGIDIDHCLNGNIIEHEEKEKIAQLIIEANTYCEISPSKTGLHLYFALSEPLTLIANKHQNFEAYTSGRYFTVTQNPYKELRAIREITPKEALTLLSIIRYPWRKETQVENPKVENNSVGILTLDDETLLEKMFSSKSGTKIKMLYKGDTSEYGGDKSSADMALLSYLAFWTRKNSTQMDRLWLASSLGAREKTQTREDYRTRTINTAIRNCKEIFSPKKNLEENKIKPDKITLITIRASDVSPKRIQWLWEGKIAKGKLTLLVGNPGLGKSQITASMAAYISTGNPWPLHTKEREPSGVVMLSGEDDFEDTIVPRLIALNAKLDLISLIQFAEEVDKDGKKIRRTFNLTLDIPQLEKLFSEKKNISLLIVDPITAYLGDVDSHKNAEVRAVLANLSAIASKYKVAVLAVTHFNKNGNPDAQMRVMGSLAFVAAARAAFLVTKDEKDENRRLFLPMKNNLAKDTGGLSYTIQSKEIYIEGENIETSVIEWGNTEIKQTANEAMRGSDKDRSPQLEEAKNFLTEVLTEKKDGIDGTTIKKMAKECGISDRTLYRAAKEMGVEQRPDGFGKPRIWRLLENILE